MYIANAEFNIRFPTIISKRLLKTLSEFFDKLLDFVRRFDYNI